jgi:hypothetical protein
LGLRSAAHICQRVTNAIAFIMYKLGVCVLNNIDDLAGVETRSKAPFAYNCLGQVLKECGLVECTDKACPPSEIMIV